MRLVADCRCVLGEGPVWNPHDERLYWTDIEGEAMYRLEPESGKWERFYQGPSVSGIVVHQDGSLLLFGKEGSIRRWTTEGEQTLREEIPDERGGRFNDVFTDSQGRVFAGTMPANGAARLYRIDLDGSLERVQGDVGLANGMDLSPDGKNFYFTDTGRKTIWKFDYTEASGAITNRRPFAVVTEEGHHPDGLAVDEQGGVWSARWGGSCVVRYDASGVEVERHQVPVKNVTSCAFVGTSLFVTTAGHGSPGCSELAGGLFCMDAGVAGRPQFLAAVEVNR